MITVYQATLQQKGHHYSLVKQMIMQHIGHHHAIKIDKDIFGKPFCPGLPIQFNISHTKNQLLVAISQTPVGVDIESTSRKIDPRVFDRYAPQDTLIKHVNMVSYWVIVESAAKFFGQGIQNIQNMIIHQHNNKWYHIKDTASGKDSWTYLCCDKDWTWAVTSDSQQPIQHKTWLS